MLRHCRGKLLTPDPHNVRCEHNLLKCDNPDCGQTGCTNPNCTRHNFQGTVCQSCFNHNADYHDPEFPTRGFPSEEAKKHESPVYKSSTNAPAIKQLDNGICNMLGPFSMLIKLLIEILNVLFGIVLWALKKLSAKCGGTNESRG